MSDKLPVKLSIDLSGINLSIDLSGLYMHFDTKLDNLQATVNAVLAKVTTMDAATQAALNALSAEVARETSLEQSVKTLLEGLAAQIEALKANQTDPAVIAAIQSAADLVKANNDSFAADVVANTPAS